MARPPKLPGEEVHYQRYEPRCKHKDCKYRQTQNNRAFYPNACAYAYITGKIRSGQLPPDQRDPALCPLYEKEKRTRMRQV